LLMQSPERWLDRKILVADIGCGDCKLRKLLDERRFAYEAYDLMPQTSEVRALDIRLHGLPHDVDVAVLLGVLEYIDNPASVIRRLASQAGEIVVSHRAADLRGVGWWQRRKRGWRTIMTTGDFERMLLDNGFAVNRRVTTPDGKTGVWHATRQAHTFGGPS